MTMTTAKRKAATKGKAARVTAVANQKGGVGKTTTAHALVTGLALKGYKVLAVDFDPQEDLTFTMNPTKNTPNMYDLMKAAAAEYKDTAAMTIKAIQHTPQGDIIPSDLDLTAADMEFCKTGREYLLNEIIDPLRSMYDHIIIDTPPNLGILTIDALTAANDVVIPLGANAYSFKGFSRLLANINTVKKRCNPKLEIAGLLVTKYNERTAVAKGVMSDIEAKAKELRLRLFKSVIKRSAEVEEAQLEQRNLYNKKAKPVVAQYLAFVEEYLKGVK
jgi:chromosome partitioning protein